MHQKPLLALLSTEPKADFNKKKSIEHFYVIHAKTFSFFVIHKHTVKTYNHPTYT